MPFSLFNAPATFQAFMNKILFQFLDISVVVYLDDILIFSKDEESHQRHVKEVLDCLKEFNLFCKLKKCKFTVSEVEFLGYQIKEGGLPSPLVKYKKSWSGQYPLLIPNSGDS